jgi:hypothetical protein
MTIPAFLLGMVFATLYGAVFHIWRGGSLGRLFLYILISWAGFWSGHFLSAWQHWTLATLGPLNFGAASMGSLIFLLLGHWLSQVEISNANGDVEQ